MVLFDSSNSIVAASDACSADESGFVAYGVAVVNCCSGTLLPLLFFARTVATEEKN